MRPRGAYGGDERPSGGLGPAGGGPGPLGRGWVFDPQWLELDDRESILAGVPLIWWQPLADRPVNSAV